MKIPVFVFCLLLLWGPRAAAQSGGGGYQLKKIVLDAGHGGDVPGATAGGFREKDIVLDVALRVGRLIDEHLPDVEVVYTRRSDIDVDLAERGNIANRAQADLFISIHADAVRDTRVSGSSSWVMGLSREQANLELAMRENSVITYEQDYQTKYEGFDPNDPASYIMFTLMQSAHLDQSIALGTLFQKHYGQNTTIPTTRGVKQNIFVVLHRTTMPAVLTEIGFLTNAADRAFMTSEAGKQQIARSIFDAISEYKGRVEGHARLVVAAPQDTPAATATQPEQDTGAEQTAASAGPVFRIQVSASRNPVARSRFGSYSRQVVEVRDGRFYKYFVGQTGSYTEALALQGQVRRTFRDAFVVPFVNGAIVPLTDELKR